MREKECEDLRHWRLKCFRRYFASKHPVKWCMCLAHDWNVKSQDRMETADFREYLTGKAFSRDTRETFCFARLSFLIHIFCAYTIYILIAHRCLGLLLRENPCHKSWELEIFIPKILYTNTWGFSSTPTSPFPYHWEVDSLNTYHTLLECSMRFWCCWEALEEARLWQMQSGVLWDPES